MIHSWAEMIPLNSSRYYEHYKRLILNSLAFSLCWLLINVGQGCVYANHGSSYVAWALSNLHVASETLSTILSATFSKLQKFSSLLNSSIVWQKTKTRKKTTKKLKKKFFFFFLLKHWKIKNREGLGLINLIRSFGYNKCHFPLIFCHLSMFTGVNQSNLGTFINERAQLLLHGLFHSFHEWLGINDPVQIKTIRGSFIPDTFWELILVPSLIEAIDLTLDRLLKSTGWCKYRAMIILNVAAWRRIKSPNQKKDSVDSNNHQLEIPGR